MTYFLVLFAMYGAVLFAALASFGCVVSERRARGEKFSGGRSHCACGRQLKVTENIPLVGWLRVRGVARCCGAQIPKRYVLAEAIGALVGVLVGLVVGAGLFQGRDGVLVVAAGLVVAAVFLQAVVLVTKPTQE